MLIWIIALLLFISLPVLHFLKINKKIYIMAGVIVLLLLLHITDQLISPKPQIEPKKTYKQNKRKIQISNQLYKNSPSRTLIKEERQLLNYLTNKWDKHENIILSLKNIDPSRFRAIFKEFQQNHGVKAVQLDYHVNQYTYSQIQQVLENQKCGNMVYMLVENANKLKFYFQLENIYHVYNVSMVLRDPNQIILPMTSISNWMSNYEFQGSYVNQILQNHPPKLVQICSKYRTFDYSFYLLSQTEPISELCTKLPSNKVTECVREHIKNVDDRVPFCEVKYCWKNEKNMDGIIIQNGMVSVKKDYFYSGKVDKGIFVQDWQNQKKQL